MPPVKRRAGVQLTRDAVENENEVEDGDFAPDDVQGAGSDCDPSFNRADEATMANREVVSVRRPKDEVAPSQLKSATAWPKFKLSAAAPVFQPVSSPEPVAANENPLAKFMPAAGSWECPVCLLVNKKNDAVCPACETPRPSASAKVSKSPETKLKPVSGPGPTTVNGFTFGVTAASESPIVEHTESSNPGPTTVGGFTFGISSAANDSKPAAANPPSTANGFSFGSASSLSFSALSAQDNKGAASFSFGSSGQTELPSFDAAAFAASSAPTVSEEFKNAVAAERGDEDDDVLYKIRVQVHKLMKPEEGVAAGKLKYAERGVGELHVNKYQEDDRTKGRLIIRTERTQRLILNAPVFKQMSIDRAGDSHVRIIGMEDGNAATYLLRTKTKSESDELISAIKKLIDSLSS